METFRFVFGAVFFAFGGAMILSRERIYAWQQSRRLAHPSVPMYWTVLGGLFALNGIGWLIVAFVDQ